MKITDQIGREIIFDSTPKRIISLVPSQTELLFDLGLEDSIIGITKFCVHPYHAKQTKKIVGGTKNIKIEKIKELNPDIILCNSITRCHKMQSRTLIWRIANATVGFCHNDLKPCFINISDP